MIRCRKLVNFPFDFVWSFEDFHSWNCEIGHGLWTPHEVFDPNGGEEGQLTLFSQTFFLDEKQKWKEEEKPTEIALECHKIPSSIVISENVMFVSCRMVGKFLKLVKTTKVTIFLAFLQFFHSQISQIVGGKKQTN